MINFLKNSSFKKIMVLLLFFTLIMFGISSLISMHYIFSTSISEHMGNIWQRQAYNIAKEARFSIVTESKSDVERVIRTMLMDDPLITHISLYVDNKPLYSSGTLPSSCINISLDSSIDNENYWCFNAPVNANNINIGNVILIVSKKEIKGLIRNNLLANGLTISLISLTLFSLLYMLTNRLTSPLEKLALIMNKIKDNERGLRVHKEGSIDIRKIQNSFNDMIIKIEQHESNLEDKVKERTIELSNAYRKSQGASQLKTDILKIVSHEMRSPLHSAMYFLDLMKSNKGNYIPEIMDSHERLEIQIENLLSYYGSIQSDIKLSKTSFSLHTLLEIIKNEYWPIIQNNNNQLIINSNYNGTLYSDRQLIQQIVSNLLGNANKFTFQGKIILACTSQNNNIVITVTDTGCGISKDNLESIFNPFWQVDMSSARIHEGSGLGLSICHLFAEAIEAKITVSSEVNIGSVFTLSIPLRNTLV